MNIRRLQALGALDHVKANSLTFGQGAETFGLNLAEMNKKILSVRLFDESVALFGTKPLDSPLSQPYNLHLFRGDTQRGPTPV